MNTVSLHLSYQKCWIHHTQVEEVEVVVTAKENVGWVCFRSPRAFFTEVQAVANGMPSDTHGPDSIKNLWSFPALIDRLYIHKTRVACVCA